jgi:oligoendopeptidase F
MKRSEVKPENTWNLSDIFINAGEWENEFARLNTEIVRTAVFRGRLGDKKTLLDALRFCDGLSARIEKIYVYAMFCKDENGRDPRAAALRARAETLYVRFGAEASFITPELSALEETALEAFIADPDFSDYDYMLKSIIREKKHILSEKEEKLLALGGRTFSAFREIFSNIDDVDLPLGTIKADGKTEKLSHGKYGLFLQHKDQGVRKKAFDAMYKAVGSLVNTIAANYAASVGKDNFLASARGYGSALARALGSNDVPVAVYDTLVERAGANLGAVHDYVKLRKKILGLPVQHMYDLYTPLFDNASVTCGYDKAYAMVAEGLKPLGGEYAELLERAKSERWIDVEETEDKHSGAYSCGVYGVHPYVLLNYHPTVHDIFTIAHEAGHAMHSYYSSGAQPYAKHDYSIFVAEVASTVNEVLLLKHMLAVSSDNGVKKYLLSYYLDMFRTTLFRQTMFAEFERDVHAADAEGSPLTVESLSKAYFALNKKYYGAGVRHDAQIRFEWARIPHFYRAFYVYQYATGLVSAVNIAGAILADGEPALARYKEFLSAGGKKSPYEILKDCGVDLCAAAPYDKAFGEFRSALAELEALSPAVTEK